MDNKLINNLGKMIWKQIEELDSSELGKIEEKYKIEFPKKDRKYLRLLNLGKAVNIIFNIENEKFYLKFDTLEYKYFSENLKYFHRLTGNYFENRKIIPIISNTKFLTQPSELKEFVIAYDFTNNLAVLL